jgi:ABC-type multidrug transport system fused ATPase/permease subunit
VIFVVDEGEIAERGNHEELMKLNGIYAELHNLQFKQEDIYSAS